jgi:glycosyltransferase involved in cell wall biosynthesis
MKNKRKAIVCVSNDLLTDNRVAKTCAVLQEQNYEVILVGRKKNDSPRMDNRSYKTYRLSLPFEKGPLFYVFLNVRLFLFLLLKKSDLIYANDLDTLAPCFLVSKLKTSRLIYDTHELFTEVPELTSRPRIQKVWLNIEKFFFPKLKNILTVNESIARIYEKKYNKTVHYVRNVPLLMEQEDKILSRLELGINEKDFVLIIQGSGLNKDRGIEEAIMALEYCKDCVLLLVGNGDVIPFAKRMVLERQMQSKVKFIPRMPYNELMRITRGADLGLLLDKNTSLNQGLALPNKLFDYMHAGIPILSSDLKEITKIITQYDIGSFIKTTQPEEIAEAINAYKSDKARQRRHRSNCLIAAQEENWQKEKEKLIAVIMSSERE